MTKGKLRKTAPAPGLQPFDVDIPYFIFLIYIVKSDELVEVWGAVDSLGTELRFKDILRWLCVGMGFKMGETPLKMRK